MENYFIYNNQPSQKIVRSVRKLNKDYHENTLRFNFNDSIHISDPLSQYEKSFSEKDKDSIWDLKVSPGEWFIQTRFRRQPKDLKFEYILGFNSTRCGMRIPRNEFDHCTIPSDYEEWFDNFALFPNQGRTEREIKAYCGQIGVWYSSNYPADTGCTGNTSSLYGKGKFKFTKHFFILHIFSKFSL